MISIGNDSAASTHPILKASLTFMEGVDAISKDEADWKSLITKSAVEF